MASAQISKASSLDSIKLEQGLANTASPAEDAVATSQDAVATPEDESKYITGTKLYLINTALIVSIFIAQLDSSIVSTAVVDITDQLGGYEKSSWLFTAYLITFCGMCQNLAGGPSQQLTMLPGFSMIWAKISDIAGRKITLIVCLGIFTFSSALCAAAQTIDQLIMFRWLQGAGGGGVYGLVQLMFLELVPRRKLPAYMSMVTSALALSLVVGPLLGGGITLHGSWRWIFIIK
jgi:MFS family permease